MPLSLDQVEKTIKEVEHLVDPRSKRYGRLLNWQNPPDPFWHYGIGLSDTHIFDTGQGLCSFEKQDVKLVLGVDSIAFEPPETIERLKQALRVFHNFADWNCEHLARLIATNQPRCYQSGFLWWLCNMTPEGDHKTALHDFNSFHK